MPGPGGPGAGPGIGGGGPGIGPGLGGPGFGGPGGRGGGRGGPGIRGGGPGPRGGPPGRGGRGVHGMGRGGFFAPGPTISTRGYVNQNKRNGGISMSEPNTKNAPEVNPEEYVPTEQSARYSLYALKFAAIVAMASIASNFMASKLWTIFGLSFDGGLILYPLTFIFSDVIIELYSREHADRLNNYVCGMNIVVFLAIWLMNRAPNYEGAAAVDLSLLYGRSLRIVAASVIGYWVSHWLNNYFHEVLFNDTERIGLRSWGSSFIGHAADTAIFNLLAFFGVMNGLDLVWHMVYAFGVSLLIETIVCTFFIGRICQHYACKIAGVETPGGGARKFLSRLLRGALSRIDDDEAEE